MPQAPVDRIMKRINLYCALYNNNMPQAPVDRIMKRINLYCALYNNNNMPQAPVDRIMKINQFLGLNRGRALCEQIAKACHFPNLKAVKDGQIPQEIKEMAWRNGAPGIFRKHNKALYHLQ
ncbi:hypothetical protein ACOMHN_015714 [Nucella lapillus]